jgi:Niemann-Pick C1 protein
MKNIPHLFTLYGLFEAAIQDIAYDFSLVSSAILLVVVYTFFMLGTFSTIHCRVWVAFTGICCILLAYGAGFGFMYLIQQRSTGVHQLMPFLLVGIGVDDMFVMCNAID